MAVSCHPLSTSRPVHVSWLYPVIPSPQVDQSMCCTLCHPLSTSRPVHVSWLYPVIPSPQVDQSMCCTLCHPLSTSRPVHVSWLYPVSSPLHKQTSPCVMAVSCVTPSPQADQSMCHGCILCHPLSTSRPVHVSWLYPVSPPLHKQTSPCVMALSFVIPSPQADQSMCHGFILCHPLSTSRPVHVPGLYPVSSPLHKQTSPCVCAAPCVVPSPQADQSMCLGCILVAPFCRVQYSRDSSTTIWRGTISHHCAVTHHVLTEPFSIWKGPSVTQLVLTEPFSIWKGPSHIPVL